MCFNPYLNTVCNQGPLSRLLLFLQEKYKESWSGGEICDRQSPGRPPSPSSASLSLISSYPAAD